MKKNPLVALLLVAVCVGIYAFLFFNWQNRVPIGEAQSDPNLSTEPEAERPTWWAPNEETPEGFVQIIPRGALMSVDNPDYVSAEDAKIGEDSFVLGLVIDGEALAYSLNLLNEHEVINDSVGETNFACVW